MSTPKREMSPPQVLRELYDAQRSPVPQSASLVQLAVTQKPLVSPHTQTLPCAHSASVWQLVLH